MPKPNFIFKVTRLFVFCLLASTLSYAQTEQKSSAEKSYEVILQIVVGSASDAAAPKNNLPANLAAVTKNLRNNFSFANYQLSDTYIGRVADTGGIEFKTISDNFGRAQNTNTPVFLDWTVGSLKNAASEKGQNTIQIQPFRFGARVPIVTGNGVINYESIGLNLHKVSLPENSPTLIGTLPTPRTGETIFLVLTIKRAGE